MILSYDRKIPDFVENGTWPIRYFKSACNKQMITNNIL